MPGIADHVFVLVFAFILPLRGASLAGRGLASFLAAEGDGALLRFYTQSTIMHVVLLTLAIALWLVAGRALIDLGLGVPDPVLFATAMVAVAAGLGGHWLQGYLGLRRTSDHASNLARLGHIQPLIPSSRAEFKRFSILAALAGFSEEILYRGFLPTYLAYFIPQAAAVTASVLLFGLGHVYQGARGVIQTTVIGAVLMGMYLLTDSLWPGIVFHSGFNLISGQLTRELVRNTR